MGTRSGVHSWFNSSPKLIFYCLDNTRVQMFYFLIDIFLKLQVYHTYLCRSTCEPVFNSTAGWPSCNPGCAGDNWDKLPPACRVTNPRLPIGCGCFWLWLVAPWNVCRFKLLLGLTVGDTYASFPCAASMVFSSSIEARTSACLGLWPLYLSGTWWLAMLCLLFDCECECETFSLLFEWWWRESRLELFIRWLFGMRALVSPGGMPNWQPKRYASFNMFVSMSSCLIGVSITWWLEAERFSAVVWLMTFFLLLGVPKYSPVVSWPSAVSVPVYCPAPNLSRCCLKWEQQKGQK